jgi:MFS family permease
VAAVALALLIARDHPATAVGGLLLAESLPMLLSAHTGAIADRFERRRLMIGCQLLQGVIFGVITFWLPPYWALLGLVLLASLLGTLLRATTQTAVRALVPGEQLMAANGMVGTALWGAYVIGPAVGGALAGLAGPRLALGVDTATFVLSAATLLALPLLPRIGLEGSDSGGVTAAIRYAAKDPVLRSMILAIALLVAFAGVDNVAIVYLVRDTLHGSKAAYGFALAVFAVGMVLGSALIIRFPLWRPERALFGSMLATSVGTLGLGLAPTLAAIFPFQIVGGAGNGVEVAAQTTIIQRRTPESMLGRISGASNSAVAVGFLFAYLGGGAIIDATSPRTALVIAGIGTLAALLVLMPVWRLAPPPAPTSPQP